jgi:hypothetical protein
LRRRRDKGTDRDRDEVDIHFPLRELVYSTNRTMLQFHVFHNSSAQPKNYGTLCHPFSHVLAAARESASPSINSDNHLIAERHITMWFSFARKWGSRSFPSVRAKAKRQHGIRPGLESLEDRLAPAVLTVNTLLDTSGNYDLSLRDAITAVDTGSTHELTAGEILQVVGPLGQNDTIVFAPWLTGTIPLNSSLPEITTSVQIMGLGSSQLTIDGQDANQIFSVSQSAGYVSITGLALTNGYAYNGGAIEAGVNDGSTTPPPDSTNLSVSNCTFSDNQASDGGFGGGAIAIFSGSLTVAHSVFTNNSAPVGGAIDNDDGNMDLSYDSFSGNTASDTGGAIGTSGDSALTAVQNCVFTDNSASIQGGGGAIGTFGGNLIVTNDSFTGNSASVGGAIQTFGPLSVAASTFVDNSTNSADGGAIDVNDPAVIIDSTFVGNTCFIDGGAVCAESSSTLQLTNDTLCGNSASDGNGSGLDVEEGAFATLDNTIVAENYSINNGYNDIGGTVASDSASNLIGNGNNAGGLTNESNGNLIGVNPALLPMGNYGGPTETMLPAAGSPVIDAGSSAFVTDQETDQRGFSRTSGSGGDHVDIGAVEVQPAGVGTHLELQGPGSVSVDSAMSWTATALDDNNLPAYSSSGPIVMSVASGPGNFTSSSTTVANAVYGTAAFNNLTLNAPGDYKIQASFGNSSVTAPVAILGQLAFNVEPESSTKAGTVLNTIEVGIYGVGATGIVTTDDCPVTLILINNSNDQPADFRLGDWRDSITVNAVNGIATFNSFSGTDVFVASSSSYFFQAIAGNLITYSTSFTVTPAAASQLAFVQQPPTNVTVGTVISPPVIVAVEDAYGNIVTNNTTTIVVKAVGPGGITSGTTTKAAVNGEVTFNNLVLGKTGSYTITAQSSTGLSATSNSFTVSAADPIVGPFQSTVVDSKLAVPLFAKVAVVSSGAPIAGVAVTFTAPAIGPSGTFAGKRTVTVRTNADGIATAPAFTANTEAGSFDITVGFGGAAPPETIALTNVAGPPAHVTAAGGTPQSIVVDTSLDTPLSAKVTDRFGNPVPGASVMFTAPVNGSNGTFTGNLTTVTVTTNSLGIALAPTFTANTKAGTYDVVAAVNGIAVGVKYQLTNVAGAPIYLIVGPTQSAVIGDAYAHALTATVTDAYGNPISGIAVTFTAPESGASGTFAKKQTVTAITNADGVAIAPSFTSDTTTGEFLVEVSALDLTSGFIQLTNLSRPA